MNLHQLKSVCEIVDHSLSITEAANAMFRTQSSVTRQLQELEEELGMEIFTRRRNKVLGITPRGKELLTLARRMVQDAETLKNLTKRGDIAQDTQITIAATLTQARYFLPDAIGNFTARHAHARFHIMQGIPSECYQYVRTRQADFAICGERAEAGDAMVEIPLWRFSWVAVAPIDHPLLSIGRPVTPEDFAQYPLIRVARRARPNGSPSSRFPEDVKAPIMLTSGSAEVCKSYVERGMGVAIIPRLTFDAKRDAGLGCIEVSHLYPPATINLIAKKNMPVTSSISDFVRVLAPGLAGCDVESLFAGAPLPAEMELPLH